MLHFRNEDSSARHAERVSSRLRVRRDRFLTDISTRKARSRFVPSASYSRSPTHFDSRDHEVDSNPHEQVVCTKIRSDCVHQYPPMSFEHTDLDSPILLQNQKYGVGVDAHCTDAVNRVLPSRVYARVLSPLQLLFKNMILWDLAPEAPSIPQSRCRLVTLQHCIAIPWKRLLRCNYKAVGMSLTLSRLRNWMNGADTCYRAPQQLSCHNFLDSKLPTSSIDCILCR